MPSITAPPAAGGELLVVASFAASVVDEAGAVVLLELDDAVVPSPQLVKMANSITLRTTEVLVLIERSLAAGLRRRGD